MSENRLEALALRPSQGHHHNLCRKPLNPLAAPFTKKHVVQEDLEPRLWRQPLCLWPQSKGTIEGWLCSCNAQGGTQQLSRPRNLLSYLLGKFRNRSCPIWRETAPPSGCP